MAEDPLGTQRKVRILLQLAIGIDLQNSPMLRVWTVRAFPDSTVAIGPAASSTFAEIVQGAHEHRASPEARSPIPRDRPLEED